MLKNQMYASDFEFMATILGVHHQHLVATKRACSVREYEARETFIHSMSCASISKEAQASINSAVKKRKRNLSEETKNEQIMSTLCNK